MPLTGVVSVIFTVGVVIFMIGWIGLAAGQILWMVERSGVRRGWRRAATAGLLLARDRARVTDGDSLHQKRIELDQALARWTRPDTLLFAPTSNSYQAFALDWFGRAHRVQNDVLVEARFSVGQTMTLAAYLVVAVAMVLMTTGGGAFLVLLGVIPLVLLCVRGYRRSLRNEQQLAKQILREVRDKLERS